MSDTDIYTDKQVRPQGKHTKPKRRRRRSTRKFDAKKRRRSKNSGMRRLFHLARKEENEKIVWGTFFIVAIILLVLVGIWQFWVLERIARQDDAASLAEKQAIEAAEEGTASAPEAASAAE